MSIAEKLITIAENEQKVYDTGKQSMNDAWWKAKTNNYTRTEYNYGFAYTDFTHLDGFNPPITIQPVGEPKRMFFSAKGVGEITADKLDLSMCTAVDYVFGKAQVTRIELIDTRSCLAVGSILIENTDTATIDKFILKEDGSQTISQYAFNSAYVLANISFEGVIGCNVWFTHCDDLTRESAINIFNALKDYSQDTAATHTIDLHAKCIDRLSEADKAIATQKGWTIT